MKKLITMIMFMAFLVMPVSVNAGACERYWDGLVGQTFAITVDEIEFTVYFSDSVCGPCPDGIATLYYTDVQINDGVEYVAELEFELYYATTPGIVTVSGLDFILTGGQLILLPDDPWIFDIVEEDIL